VRVFGACALGAVLAFAPAVAQVAAPELLKPENRTVSNSRQFTLFGGSREQRAALARRAEELRAALQRELQDTEAWKTPVLIVLTPGDGVRLRQSPVMLQVFDAEEAGRKIQVDMVPGAAADTTAVDRAILHALLFERSLRKQKLEGGRFVEPPDWLSSAVTAALGREASRDASLYAGLLEGRGMPRLDRFLRQNGATLKGRARDLHAAQSLALYSGLLEMPEGRSRILSNLMLPEPERDPMQRFAQTWPELAEDQPKLARLWALSVARFSSPKKLEFLGAEDTGKKLRLILQGLDSSAEGQPSAESLVALSRKEDGRFRLGQAATETQRLALRAHPLYASVVGEYAALLDNLARKRRRGFETRFLEAEDLRLELDDRSSEITDFMNWYQANEENDIAIGSVARRSFAGEPAARRDDKISRFLDSVEQRGW